MEIKPPIRDAKQIQLIYVGGTNYSVLCDCIDHIQSYSNFVSAEAKPNNRINVIGHANKTDNPIFDIPIIKGDVFSQINIVLLKKLKLPKKKQKSQKAGSNGRSIMECNCDCEEETDQVVVIGLKIFH